MEEIFNGYVLPDTFYPVPKLGNYVHLGSERSYLKGETILLPGEVLGKAIFVISGRLKVSSLTDDSREIFIYSAGKSCFMDRLFNYCVERNFITADEDSKVCFFTKEQLLMIFKQDEEVILDIYRNLSSKNAYYINQIQETHLFSPSIRVFRLLYELYKTNGKWIDHSWQINVSLSNKKISEITGLHFVTVSKIFGFLKKQKILKKIKTKIIIYDEKKLKELTRKAI